MGIVICHKCKGKVSDLRKDCPHCGASMEIVKTCPDCMEEIAANLTECPICGHYFNIAKTNVETKNIDKSNESINNNINSSNNIQPEYLVVEEKQEEPIVEEKQEEPFVEEKQEEPLVEEKQEEPVVEEKQEKKITSTQSDSEKTNSIICPYCKDTNHIQLGINYYLCCRCKYKYFSFGESIPTNYVNKSNEKNTSQNIPLEIATNNEKLTNVEENIKPVIDDANDSSNEQEESSKPKKENKFTSLFSKKEKEEKPAKVKEEKPTKVKEEKPAKVKEDKPAKVKEEKPAKVKEEKPAKVKKEKPAKVKEEKPAKVKKEKPVKAKIGKSKLKLIFGIGIPSISLLAVFAVALVIVVFLLFPKNTITKDYITYEKYIYAGEEKLKIVSVDKSKISGDIIIPDEINGLIVNQIDDSAFDACGKISSIVLPSTIIYIGDNAFNLCIELERIAIPESVTVIGDNAFKNCPKLTIYCEAIILPIGWSSNWNINSRPVEWAYNTFKVVFEENNGPVVNDLNVKNGSKITLPSIERSGFDFLGWYKDKALKHKWDEENDEVTSNITLYAKWELSVDDSGFVFLLNSDGRSCRLSEYNGNKTTVTIPAYYSGIPVTAIEKNAFYNNADITYIKISRFVTNIAPMAFSGCSSLLYIDVDISNTTYSSLDGNLYDKEYEILYKYASGNVTKTFILPSSVIIIESNAFDSCFYLESVEISYNLKRIYSYAFYNCPALKELYIPSNVIEISQMAFQKCPNLKISCQAFSKPQGWSNNWNSENYEVNWGM